MANEQMTGLAIQAHLKRLTNPESSTVRDVKHSLAFQYRGEDLFQTIPVALCSMGACCAAAGFDYSQGRRLDKPASGDFKYLP
jgi:hypothetical protein